MALTRRSYERAVDGHRAKLGDAHHHRPSLLKVATGFKLAKRLPHKRLRKTLVQDVEMREFFEPKDKPRERHNPLLSKEKQLAAIRCNELF